MNTEPQPPTLGYSAPDLFFEGHYSYRRPGALVAAIATFGMAAVLARFAIALPRDRIGAAGALAMGSTAAVCLLVAGYLFYSWCVRRELVAQITAEGVRFDREFWPWPSVARLGGVRHRGGIAFVVQSAGAVWMNRTVPTTPLLTDERFAEVVDRVGTYLSTTYPQVTVDPEPRVEY